MRIGVVSDTHLPQFGRALPRALVDGLRDAAVERVLHLGDHTEPDVPALFEAIAPFDAVAGNNDGEALVERYGRVKVLTLDGVRIGMTHGDLGAGRTTPERAASTFSADSVDVVLFGHSHIPLLARLEDGRWLLNPGSPTARRQQPRFSWAVLDVALIDGVAEVRGELRFYDDRSI
jgi:putative phosphoesterase